MQNIIISFFLISLMACAPEDKAKPQVKGEIGEGTPKQLGDASPEATAAKFAKLPRFTTLEYSGLENNTISDASVVKVRASVGADVAGYGGLDLVCNGVFVNDSSGGVDKAQTPSSVSLTFTYGHLKGVNLSACRFVFSTFVDSVAASEPFALTYDSEAKPKKIQVKSISLKEGDVINTNTLVTVVFDTSNLEVDADNLFLSALWFECGAGVNPMDKPTNRMWFTRLADVWLKEVKDKTPVTIDFWDGSLDNLAFLANPGDKLVCYFAYGDVTDQVSKEVLLADFKPSDRYLSDPLHLVMGDSTMSETIEVTAMDPPPGSLLKDKTDLKYSVKFSGLDASIPKDQWELRFRCEILLKNSVTLWTRALKEDEVKAGVASGQETLQILLGGSPCNFEIRTIDPKKFRFAIQSKKIDFEFEVKE